MNTSTARAPQAAVGAPSGFTRRSASVSVASVLVALLWVSNAFGQIATDHFKCYNILDANPPVMNEPVQLQDQFSPGWFIPAFVGPAFKLCNPVQKTVLDGTPEPEPIINGNNHLTFYRLQSPEVVNIPVEVRNQFGIQNLVATFPVLLAVPTRKLPHPAPANLDHFKCYAVAGGQPVNLKVNLLDQFQNTLHGVGVPTLLCNPTRKIHEGVQAGVSNPDEHLVCYRINRQPFVGDRFVINQMRTVQQHFELEDADRLCVPSKKRILAD
jgi:hypothetical protein